MKIDKLPIGTKLMWDTESTIGGGKYIYPAIITMYHIQPHPLKVKIKTKLTSSWMSEECEYLRYPTEEELNSLQWPEI